MKASREKTILLVASTACSILIIESTSYALRKILSKGNKNVAEIGPENIDVTNSFSQRTHRDFRLSRPLPYKESHYFDWFIKEEWTDKHPECSSKITHDGTGNNLKQTDTPDCKGTTIINGWRKTIGQPQSPKHTIFIFGGSTVYGHEVPNNYTIPSLLQSLLNKNGYKDYAVENRGFTTVTTNQQNSFLSSQNIRKGDIIIYYDGGNNIWQGVVNNSPNGTIIGSNRSSLAKIVIFGAVKRLQSYKLVEYLRSRSQNTSPPDSQCHATDLSDSEINNRADASFDAYKKSLGNAYKIADSKGAKFIHFFQPHLFSNKTKQYSVYEQKLINTTPSDMIPCMANIYLTRGFNVFDSRYGEISRLLPHAQNISQLVWNSNNQNSTKTMSAKRPEIFLDWIHITEAGNKRIADAMYRYLNSKKLIHRDSF